MRYVPLWSPSGVRPADSLSCVGEMKSFWSGRSQEIALSHSVSEKRSGRSSDVHNECRERAWLWVALSTHSPDSPEYGKENASVRDVKWAEICEVRLVDVNGSGWAFCEAWSECREMCTTYFPLVNIDKCCPLIPLYTHWSLNNDSDHSLASTLRLLLQAM